MIELPTMVDEAIAPAQCPSLPPASREEEGTEAGLWREGGRRYVRGREAGGVMDVRGME